MMMVISNLIGFGFGWEGFKQYFKEFKSESSIYLLISINVLLDLFLQN